jgi:hypothetical protein
VTQFIVNRLQGAQTGCQNALDGSAALRKDPAMATWGFDPLADAIRAEREREVAELQLQWKLRAARKAHAQTAGTPWERRSLPAQLRHFLLVLVHRAQGHPAS